MRPFARIRQGETEFVGSLGRRLLSLEIHDEAEDKSDRVSILIDSSPIEGLSLDVPHLKSVVTIEIGYLDGPALGKGSYRIDGFNEGRPPRELTISGRAADMPSKFRTPRTQSYHQETLGSILSEIAERNGYSAAIDSEVSAIVVRHADQTGESDMAFAARLAGDYDAVARPVEGRLVVARRGAAMAATGAALPPVTILETDCARWDFDYSARDEAGEAKGLEGKTSAAAERSEPTIEDRGGVRAYWTDIRTGRREKVEVGREPFHDLRFTYHNEAEAQAAASAYRNKASRGTSTFGCEIGGRPSVQAEAVATIVGFPPYVPNRWRIKSVVHRYDGTGYTTRIQCDLFEEAQEKVAEKVGKTRPSKDDTVDENAPSGPTKAPSSGAQNPSSGSSVGDGEYIIRLPENA